LYPRVKAGQRNFLRGRSSPRRAEPRDSFQFSVIVLSICIFAIYKLLVQLSYFDASFGSARLWGYALIAVYLLGIALCSVISLLCLMPKHLLGYLFAAALLSILNIYRQTP